MESGVKWTVILSAITIGIDPTIELGPVTVAWHGLTIAIGIVVGGMAAAYDVRRRDLDPEPLYAIGFIVVLSALVGGRVFYLLEHGLLDEPGEWLSTTGFTFYGGFIAAALGIAYYVRRNRLSLSYLDAIAAGLPLGVAVGRIGDVINGEHYGPATEFFLGVRNTHPEALTPSAELAYHSGGLYEVLLASLVFAIAWPLRKRLTRPLTLMWLVVALFAAGRFAQFFWRSDSDTVALGLETAQWTSLALLAVVAVGAWLTLARRPAASTNPRVELLWWAGCPNWEEAREIVREEMAAAGIDPDRLEVRQVKTDKAADREGFVGSPTIRVDGRDIQDPATEPAGLSCRVYRLRDGRLAGLPDPADVREALRDAGSRARTS